MTFPILLLVRWYASLIVSIMFSYLFGSLWLVAVGSGASWPSSSALAPFLTLTSFLGDRF